MSTFAPPPPPAFLFEEPPRPTGKAGGPELIRGGLSALPMAYRSGGAVVEAVGSLLGLESWKQAGAEMRKSGKTVLDYYGPETGDLTKAKSGTDFLNWLSYQVGQSIPQVAMSFLGSVGGAAAGSLGGPAGIRIGQTLGAGAISYILNAGELYADLREQGYDAPGAALLAGFPMAALDAVVPVRLGKQLLFKPAKERAIKTVLKEAGREFLPEAGTEAAQEVIGVEAQRYVKGQPSVIGPAAVAGVFPPATPFVGAPKFTPEEAARVLNAFAGGGVAGPVFGGAAATINPPPTFKDWFQQRLKEEFENNPAIQEELAKLPQDLKLPPPPDLTAPAEPTVTRTEEPVKKSYRTPSEVGPVGAEGSEYWAVRRDSQGRFINPIPPGTEGFSQLDQAVQQGAAADPTSPYLVVDQIGRTVWASEDLSGETGASPFEMARTETGGFKAGGDIGELWKVIGFSMYPGKRVPIAVKEMLQNAFDAVRGIPGGAVNADINQNTGVITISDNGIGMTKAVIQGPFSDLGVSGKRGQRGTSGEFGVAKAAFLVGGIKLSGVTTAREADGQLHTYEFSFTPEQFLKEGVPITEVSPLPATGTTLSLQFTPQEVKEGRYEANRFIEQTNKSSTLPGAFTATTANWLGQPTQTAYVPDPNRRLIATERIPGIADVELWGSSTQDDVMDLGFGLHYLVENNGAFAFEGFLGSLQGRVRGMPRTISVNVKSLVPADTDEYPFISNRTQLKDTVKEKIDELIHKNIINRAVMEHYANILNAFNRLPRFKTGTADLRFLDDGARLTKEELEALTTDPDMIRLAETFNAVITRALAVLKKSPVVAELIPNLGSRVVRTGLVYAQDTSSLLFGVFITHPGEKDKATVFINPFSFTKKAIDVTPATPPPSSTPFDAAMRIYGFSEISSSPRFAMFTDEQRKNTIEIRKDATTGEVRVIDFWPQAGRLITFRTTEELVAFLTRNFTSPAVKMYIPVGDPDSIASLMWHTIKHELLHDKISGHSYQGQVGQTNFVASEGIISEALGAFEDRARESLRKAYADPTNQSSIRPGLTAALQTYTESRRRPEVEPNLFGGEASDTEGREASGEGQERNVAGVPAGGAVPVGEEQLAPERITSTAEERGDFGTTPPEAVTAQQFYELARRAADPPPEPDPRRWSKDPETQAIIKQYRAYLDKSFNTDVAELFPEAGFQKGVKLINALGDLPDAAKQQFFFSQWLLREGKNLPYLDETDLETRAISYSVDKVIGEVVEPTEDGGPPTNEDGDSLSEEFREELRNDIDRYGWFERNWLTLLQFAENNPHILPMQEYIKETIDWWVDKTSITGRADKMIRLWERLGRKQSRSLSELLIQVAELSDRKRRRVTDAEFQAIAKKVGATEDVVKLYHGIELDFQTILAQLEDAIVQDIDRESDIGVRDALTKQARSDFAYMRGRNYFPFARHGQHVVKVKAKKNLTYEGRRYQKGQFVWLEFNEKFLVGEPFYHKLRLKKLQKQFSDTSLYEVSTGFVSREGMPFTGFPPALFERLKDKLILTEAQLRDLKDVSMSLAPWMSWIKHMRRRRGIRGFSRDAMRSYSEYFEHAAGHLARIKHRRALSDRIQEVHKSAKELLPHLRGKREEIADALAKHYNYIMNPSSDMAALRAAIFVYYFAFVPKQIVVNLTALPLLVGPYLAATQGMIPGKSDAIVLYHMGKAIKDVMAGFNFPGGKTLVTSTAAGAAAGGVVAGPLGASLGALGGLALGTSKGEWTEVGLSPREVEDFAYIASLAKFDQSFATEVAGVAHGNVLSRLLPFTSLDSVARSVTELGTLPFKMSEEFLRRVTGLATLRLAYRRGLDQTAAREAAVKAIDTTLFEYSKWNRFPMARGWKAPLFIFKMFTQGYLRFLWRGPGKGRALLALVLAAGIRGLPLADNLLDMIDALGTLWNRIWGIKEPLVDAKKTLRDLIIKVGGDPNFIMNGLGHSSFGFHNFSNLFGVPFPALDLAASVSAGRVLPGTEVFAELLKGTGGSSTEVLARLAEAVLGVPGSVGMNILRASVDHSADSLRWAKLAMPVAARNLVKAYDMRTRGAAVAPNGDKLVTFDPQDPEDMMEVLGQMIGATPTELRERQEADFAKMEAARYYNLLRESYINDYAVAMGVKEGKEEVVADARRAIFGPSGFNSIAPKDFKITWKELQESVQRRTRNRNLRERGLPTIQRYRNLYRDYEKAYPLKKE